MVGGRLSPTSGWPAHGGLCWESMPRTMLQAMCIGV